MSYFKKANRVLKRLIQSGKKDFVIFPLVERGMQIKQILNQRYGITERWVVDNGLAEESDNPDILSLKALKEVDLTGMMVLLASDQESIYHQLRCQLLEIVDREQIVDVFSPSMHYDPHAYLDGRFFENIRFAALDCAAREIYRNGVEGHIAECGVYRGDFAHMISRLLPDRKFYLFDTFEGFDERDNVDHEFDTIPTVYFNNTAVDVVLDKIGHHVDTVVRKGYFPETAKGLEEERFAFVSLDTDLYQPILAGLEFFWPRLNPGGMIFVHDFASLAGVRKAVMEYCRREHIGYMRIPDEFDTAVLSKPL